MLWLSCGKVQLAPWNHGHAVLVDGSGADSSSHFSANIRENRWRYFASDSFQIRVWSLLRYSLNIKSIRATSFILQQGRCFARTASSATCFRNCPWLCFEIGHMDFCRPSVVEAFCSVNSSEGGDNAGDQVRSDTLWISRVLLYWKWSFIAALREFSIEHLVLRSFNPWATG